MMKLKKGAKLINEPTQQNTYIACVTPSNH